MFKISCRLSAANKLRFETLEPRQLLSAAPSSLLAGTAITSQVIHAPLASAASSADGTYSGTVTVNRADGSKINETIQVDLKTGSDGRTRVKFSIPVGGITFKPSFKTILNPSGNGFLVGTIPSDAGSGTLQIQNGKKLTMNGTIDPLVFDPVPFSFSGTKGSGAAPSAEAVTAATKTNPILGSYKGSITNQFTDDVYSLKVQVSDNKLGHPVLHMQCGVSNSLEVDIDQLIHAHSTGSFMQDLGSSTADGFISGHLTHTGRFMFAIFGGDVGATTGSLKRV